VLVGASQEEEVEHDIAAFEHVVCELELVAGRGVAYGPKDGPEVLILTTFDEKTQYL
jgi:hypothetical protein